MTHINNLGDLFEIINFLYDALEVKFDFDKNGWPIFKNEHFLNQWPEDMVAYANRKNKILHSRENTLLCFFASDIQNYRRLPKILNDIPDYKQYLGATFPDITVTKDMDIELQETLMLTNQLFAAVLASNGIKLAVNTRCGSAASCKCFQHIPKGVTCASGFLGCENTKNFFEAGEYINKILFLLPNKLIIYGKQDILINKQLDILGINYRYFEDFHKRSKRKAA